MVSVPLRVTRMDWSPMMYSRKSPTRGTSSSRQAICHTRGHSRSISRSKKSWET